MTSEINAFLQTQKIRDSTLTGDLAAKVGVPAQALTAKFSSSEYGSTFRSKKKTYVVRKLKDRSRSSSRSRSPRGAKVTVAGTIHDLIGQESPAKSGQAQTYGNLLRQQIQENKLPEGMIKSLDMDRINEEHEDFLRVDKGQRLALKQQQLKPIIKDIRTDSQLRVQATMTNSSFKPTNQPPEKFLVEPRSIIGTQQFFNQGYMMKYFQAEGKKFNRRQTTRFDNSFKYKRRMTMMDKESKNKQSQT